MQEDAPAADIEYVPSAHDTHSGLPSRLSAYLPAGQLWHTAEEVLPTMSEYVPTEHEEHCELPEAAEKLPAGHGGCLWDTQCTERCLQHSSSSRTGSSYSLGCPGQSRIQKGSLSTTCCLQSSSTCLQRMGCTTSCQGPLKSSQQSTWCTGCCQATQHRNQLDTRSTSASLGCSCRILRDRLCTAGCLSKMHSIQEGIECTSGCWRRR